MPKTTPARYIAMYTYTMLSCKIIALRFVANAGKSTMCEKRAGKPELRYDVAIRKVANWLTNCLVIISFRAS